MKNKAKLSIALALSTAMVAVAAMANVHTISSSATDGSSSYSVTFNASCENDGNNFVAYTSLGNPITLQGEGTITAKPKADVMYEISNDKNSLGGITLISPIKRIDSVDITYETLGTKQYDQTYDEIDFYNSLADSSYAKRSLYDGVSGMHTQNFTHTSESYRTYFKIISQVHTYISEITVHYTCA